MGLVMRWSSWREALVRLWKDWAVTVVFGVVALWACAKVGEDVFSHETGTFDNAIQHWMALHQTRLLVAVFLAITYIGSVGVEVFAAVIAAIWLWRERGRRVAATALIAPALASALFVSLKTIFARTRPPVIGHLVLGTYAFPSGHATATTAVWCTLAYVTWREGLTSRGQAIASAVLVPLLVGLSRIYLDVHWATDVIGGWSLGLLVAVMGAVFYDRNRLRKAALDEPRAGAA